MLGTLDRYAGEALLPVLFVGEDVDTDLVSPFETMCHVEVVRSPVFIAKRFNRRLAMAFITGCDREAEAVFARNRIDVVFEPAAYYGWRFGLPTIAWIPDFQHRHLPQLFSGMAYWKREIRCWMQVATGRQMLLSSEDARKDCESFYRRSRGHTSVVRFAVLPSEDSLSDNPRSIADLYQLPDRFYYLPNQFWKHKNHTLVIRALPRLLENGLNITIAVSGKQEDPYNPGYYEGIESMIKDAGIGANFRVLGMIPYGHLIALMRASRAMINPSLCEGWSTTVEEAKSLGVPLLLSDLSVHREQAPPGTVFFDPYSVDELVDRFKELEAQTLTSRQASEANAITQAEVRVKQYAIDFTSTVEKCLDRSSRSSFWT